jgi:L-2-hydroxyglutarate oxidase
VRGGRRLREYCVERGLVYEECGKLVVARGPDEVPRLRGLRERGRTNGVRDLRWLGEQVHAVVQGSRSITLDTSREARTYDLVVACAGLYADRVARLVGDAADPAIVPFRGEYLALRPERTHLVRGLIYPGPDPRYPFLGVHLTRRVGGGVTLGETLRWPGFTPLARRHWRTGATELASSLSRRRFVALARRYLPELELADIVPAAAGVRAQAVDAHGRLVDDFRITRHGRMVNVRNAPSPAATPPLPSPTTSSTVSRWAERVLSSSGPVLLTGVLRNLGVVLP